MNKDRNLIGPDGEVDELGDAFFKRARPGRPRLPADERKRRVNVMLDPEVAEALKSAEGSTSARINRLLRDDLGL